jgi:hypothetical protein
MALGFSVDSPSGSGGSKFLQAIKFDAKSGDLIAVMREPSAEPGKWEKREEEVAMPSKFVMDMGNLEVGWITFQPTYHSEMAVVGQPLVSRPTADHKQAVRIKLYHKKYGLREWTPTAKTVLRVIDKMHDEYLAGASENKGKMPVVEFSGTETVKIQTPQGELRFKAPVLRVSGWVAPPAEFSEAPAASEAAAKADATLDDDIEF